MRRLIDALGRNAPAGDIQPLRDALPEVYGESEDGGTLDSVRPPVGRHPDPMLARIPPKFREALEAAGLEWIPAAQVYYHRDSRGMVSYEELTAGTLDLPRLRQRIAQAVSGNPA